MLPLKLLILLEFFGICFAADDSYNRSTAHCSFDILRRTTLVPSLDGRVGVGWDNLMNVPMSIVFDNTFSQCLTTPDGDFLIPDHMQVLPIKRIKLFGGSMRASYSYSTDKRINETLSKAIRHAQINTLGGPTVNRLLAQTFSEAKPAERVKMAVDDIVALDVSGVPLYSVLNENQFTKINPTRLNTIRELFKNATELYYTKNTVGGCTNSTASNFLYQANFDDGNCETPFNNYTFGGFYQTCKPLMTTHKNDWMGESRQWYSANLCDGFTQANGITSKMECPEGFDSVFLYEMRHEFPDEAKPKCYQKCSSFFGSEGCSTICTDVLWKRLIEIKIFWCKAKLDVPLKEDFGYMFGGLYKEGQENPFTGSPSCPEHYLSHRMGYDVTVCLSRDYQLGHLAQVDFGGFFSCELQVQRCEDGYSQHLITVMEHCELYYCVRPEAFNRYENNKIKRPPFEDISAIINNATESMVYIYVNDTLVVKQPIEEIFMNATKQNTTLLKTASNDEKANAVIENQIFDTWLNKTYEKIENDIAKKYAAKFSPPSLLNSTLAPLKGDDDPSLQNNGFSNHGIESNNFSSSSILILFVILMVVATITTGGIIYYKNKKRTRRYASLIEENNGFIQNYDNDDNL